MAATILDKIVSTKWDEIAQAKQRIPIELLKERAANAPSVRDFLEAVHWPGEIRLIAEVKKASPSAGLIRADFQPVPIAASYEESGAAAISVLTDESYFQGKLEYLSEIRQAVNLPVLRKDFILDSYQVYEARAAGADAVLLIAECLPNTQLNDLFHEIVSMGMTPLVELYEPKYIQRVVDLPAKLIGVNNRNLHTFQTRLEHTIELRKEIPVDRAVVGESGIRTAADVAKLREANVQAILVGESLMAQPDISTAVRTLMAY